MFSETSREGEEGLHVLEYSTVHYSAIQMTFFFSCLSVITLSTVLNHHQRITNPPQSAFLSP